uniref:WAT1-related protein n=1 Tax=Kalanchoe fedtschenkoi TaxID=63787 RepID=A0A7N0UMC8_KALFE
MDDAHSCLSSCFGKAKPYLLMVGLQFGAAGMYIITMITLNQGMSRYVLIAYRNSVAALVLAPFALLFERKIRPKMTLSVFLRIMALGFLEPVLDQNLAYLGMKYTSASYTSAIMNAVPAITFVIAAICRMERINIKELRGLAKVVGTLVTLIGALVMTLYKGPIMEFLSFGNSSTGHQTGSSGDSSGSNWILGTALILVGCCAWSAFYVLQSLTVKAYPAELTLSTLICLTGALQTSALALAMEHHASAWAIGWDSRLLAPVYTGIVSSGLTYYVQGLVMKTRGPVFVTAFNPLCMIIVAILGSIILAERIYLGSVMGGIIIAFGLYAVVWGKSKECRSVEGQVDLPIVVDPKYDAGTTLNVVDEEHCHKTVNV